MLDSFGARLKVCRTITGLSGAYIVEQIHKKGFNFSSRQFSRWENNESLNINRILKEGVLDTVVTIFSENGLPELSLDWLLYGKGIPPFLVDMSNSLDEEKAFYISRAMGKEYKLTTITSNYAEPFVSPGDTIITRCTVPEKLENKIAFVKTSSHGVHLGILNNLENKITIKNDDRVTEINKSKIKYCGRLTWIS
jgi:hypothetical protein